MAAAALAATPAAGPAPAGAIDAFLARSSAAPHAAAKAAWLASRVASQPCAVFRAGNPIVADRAGRVNARPPNGGTIDNVTAPLSAASRPAKPVSAADPEHTVAGETIDARALDGERRRGAVDAASGLRVGDPEPVVASREEDGAARTDLPADGPVAGLARIARGLASRCDGERAGERINPGLRLHDAEEAHDRVADNAHNAHVDSVVGRRNVDRGGFEGRNGAVAAPAAPDAAFVEIKQMAAGGAMADDPMLTAGHDAGDTLLPPGIDAPVGRRETLERIIAELEFGQLAWRGVVGLDPSAAVFT